MKSFPLLCILMPLFVQAQTFKKSELDKFVSQAFAQRKVAGGSVLIAQRSSDGYLLH